MRWLPWRLELAAGPDEAGAAVPLEDPQHQGDGQVSLADAGWFQRQDIGGPGDEGQAGQFPASRLAEMLTVPSCDGVAEKGCQLLPR